MPNTLRGVTIKVNDVLSQDRDTLDMLRYAIQKALIKFGDPKKHPFKRGKGATLNAIRNPFGFTFYFATVKERKAAIELIEKCMPTDLTDLISLGKTRRVTTLAKFNKHVHTFRAHAA
ncbi:hypothetical protein P3447_08600 [Vibrio parahaemolyticus]|nr:hypothetical protein [Vibrio parahaemolyticus]